VLRLAALKGVFSQAVTETVSYVNAPLLAEQRGITVRLTTDPVAEDYRNVLSIKGTTTDGKSLSVSGTLAGTKLAEKITEINGYDIEVPVGRHLVVMEYTDRPGIVAIYSKALGDAAINIAGMQMARRGRGADQLSVLTLDSAVPDEILAGIQRDVDASVIRQVEIVDL
jgi:D-3-phosphoglycerate dehydrogenase